MQKKQFKENNLNYEKIFLEQNQRIKKSTTLNNKNTTKDVIKYKEIRELINMIIDVVDLNFKTLNFTKKYNFSKYKQGRNIHNHELVEIENVNKKDENSYSI